MIFGAGDLEKAGRQHSSRIVSWTRSAQPVGVLAAVQLAVGLLAGRALRI